MSQTGTTAAAANSSRNNTNNNEPFLRKWLGIVALVFRIFLWPLRTVFNVLFPPSDLDGLAPSVTAKAAQSFLGYLITNSKHQTGDNNNNNNAALLDSERWLPMGFAAAKKHALDNQALLLVYLHSPLSPLSDQFSKHTFPLLVNSVLQQSPHIVAVGYSIASAQGSQLASSLNVTAYPCLVLLQPVATSNNTIHVLLCLQGRPFTTLARPLVLTHVQACTTRFMASVATDHARRLERAQEVTLRQQQDDEYLQTLRADQARERAEQHASAKQEAEERAREQQLTVALSLVPDQEASEGTYVRFVLPSGQKVNRRFANDTTMQVLKAYVRVYCHAHSITMGEIGLSTSFPRTAYHDKEDWTLSDAGLVGQTVFMVQDLDA